jgi:hypothetical protein
MSASIKKIENELNYFHNIFNNFPKCIDIFFFPKGTEMWESSQEHLRERAFRRVSII